MANKELLLKTLRYIEEHPEEWDQEHWERTCNSTFCFAGHAALLSGAEPPSPNSDDTYGAWYIDPKTKKSYRGTRKGPNGPLLHVDRYAQQVLQIDNEEAGRLFYSITDLQRIRAVVDLLMDANDTED